MARTRFAAEKIAAPKPSAPSSGDRGRPIADLIEEFEAQDPAGVAEANISSAALRAADAIRAMRLEASLSQSELAARIGVKPSRISELEAGVGRQGPTWSVMERIASACGKSIVFETGEIAFARQYIAAE